MTTKAYKFYSEMTPAEQAAIDACEDLRESRKAHYVATTFELREQYLALRQEAIDHGFQGNFAAACIAANGGVVPVGSHQWIKYAGAVATQAAFDLNIRAEECDFEAQYTI